MSQQSQTDVLGEICGWTRETCMKKLNSALPSVIDHLEHAVYIEDGIKTLRILCDVLLPCVAGKELEDKVFCSISKTVCGLVDEAVNKIHSNLNEALEDRTEEQVRFVVEECLQWILDIGACLECCIKQSVACASSSLDLSLVQSLPGCVLHFLRQVYKHCKESSEIYGGLLDFFSQSLSLLFKRAHSVQMLVLGLLDKLYIAGAALEEQVVVLCSVCTGLFEVCTLVTSLDVKLSVSLWKSISRLCNQHLSLLRDRLAVCPFISFLCEVIMEGYRYVFQLSPQAGSLSLCDGDDKAFNKTVRIMGFQMKVLVAILRDFSDYLGECESSLLSLLICLHRHLPPSLSASPLPDKQDAELRAQVVNATVPCLTHLVGNRAFRAVVTHDSTDLEPENKFPKLLLRLMVLDILPKCEDDVVDMWMRPDGSTASSLLSAIFSSVKQCKVEIQLPVMLPGVVVAGQRQRQVSLYQHVVTHICGMIGACSARNFNSLESTLLVYVLDNDNLLSLLATDCWCFLARYGTASLCNSQVLGLVSVYRRLLGGQTTPGKVRLSFRLANLLSRLLKFLSPEHQVALVHKFPPESNPALWLRLRPTKGLAPELARDVEHRLVNWALRVLTPSTGSVKASQLFISLQLLHEIIHKANGDKISCKGSSQLYPLTPKEQAQLLLSVMTLWTEVPTSHSSNPNMPTAITEKLLIRLLPLTSRLLHLMEAKDLLKILRTVEILVTDLKSSTEVLEGCAHFMCGFSHIKLGCSYLDCQALDLLPCVFYPLLQHSHPMVHQRALTSFSQFASLTSHEDVVPACLKGNENLVQAVQNYVNQVPHQSGDRNFQLLSYLRYEEDRLATTQKAQQTCDGQSSISKQGMVTQGKDLYLSGKRHVQDCDNQDCILEQPAKRRKAISESDEEEALTSHNMLVKADSSPSHDNSEATPSLNIPEPFSTTAASSSTSIAKKALDATSSMPSTTAVEDQFESVLAKLKDVARDLEKACSGGGSPPKWFRDQSLIELAKCQESISSNEDKCWLDNL